MHGRKLIAAAAALAGVLGAAVGEPAAEDAKLLSGADIRSRIVGNTVNGEMGPAFLEYYREDGVIKGASAEGHYDGRWYIKGDMLCFEYAEPFGCRRIALSDDSVSFITEEGQVDGTGTLLPGNPENF